MYPEAFIGSTARVVSRYNTKAQTVAHNLDIGTKNSFAIFFLPIRTATLSVPEKFEKSRVLCHAFNSERSSPPAPLSIWISFAQLVMLEPVSQHLNFSRA